MQYSFKISVMSLLSCLALSCGVLEQHSPDSSDNPSPALLPSPTVAPVIAANGKLVNAAGTTVSSTESVVGANQPQANDATADDARFSVDNIFQTDRCNQLSRGGFIWFTDEVVLNDWLSPLDKEEAKKIVSKIDFSKQGALLLDYGIAGSKGAGAKIVDNKFEIKDREAIVRVKQFKAPKNKKTVQVVTHPCSLFVMPRTGFSRLVVLSDMDDKLTSFENK